MVASSRARKAPTSLKNHDIGDVPTQKVRVIIEAPARNKRRIAACNLINAPLEIVWDVLSDYGRLSQYIPNLAVSDLLLHPSGGIRVRQCGAQSILGFEFRASLVMDMTELNARSAESRAIQFGLVESRDFSEFSGVWRMEDILGKTALYYEVNIVPRGLVPVRAIEWRISEDVPGNMDAVRMECERRRRMNMARTRKDSLANRNLGES